MPGPAKGETRPKKRGARGKTIEARENQLIALAVDLAEKQLTAGTASAQVITHYLKLGTTTERLEKEKLIRENELLKAKTDSLKSEKKVEEVYLNVLKAIRRYSGQSDEGDNLNDVEDSDV